MRPYLLDINVLLALTWPSHVFHPQAQEWFARNRAAGFRTCPLTEIGFVRISSNPFVYVSGGFAAGCDKPFEAYYVDVRT